MNTTFPLRVACLAGACAIAIAASSTAQAEGRFHGARGPRGGHAGATFENAQGGKTHVRGTRLSGERGTAVRGATTSVNPDGSVQHHSGAQASGANGGSYNSSGSSTRSADGSWQVNRQTSASGERGSYTGSTTGSDGTATHNSTITGASGNTYEGQTSVTRGQGVTHTGTCHDAQGNQIACR